MTHDLKPEGYKHHSGGLGMSHDYLLPTVFTILEKEFGDLSSLRLFEMGCGNGSVANVLGQAGAAVTGIDMSDDGIAFAGKNHPHLNIFQRSVYDDLSGEFGTFPAVLSLEVIEYLYDPRKFASNMFDLLEGGGIGIISTPYHGYWKNLALALSGRLDAHFTALWDHGHIKFWSQKTLSSLLMEAGFSPPVFYRVGRISVLAKSMIAVVKKP